MNNKTNEEMGDELIEALFSAGETLHENYIKKIGFGKHMENIEKENGEYIMENNKLQKKLDDIKDLISKGKSKRIIMDKLYE